MSNPFANVIRDADVSDDGLYRYSLTRRWDFGGDPKMDMVAWLMLNPSTADASVDDPTIRRCMNFSWGWGYNALTVVNLFALRATDPEDLSNSEHNVLGDRNHVALSVACNGRTVVCAWGNNIPKGHEGRPGFVLSDLESRKGIGLYRLGDLTKSGQPRHPLYLPGDSPLNPMRT